MYNSTHRVQTLKEGNHYSYMYVTNFDRSSHIKQDTYPHVRTRWNFVTIHCSAKFSVLCMATYYMYIMYTCMYYAQASHILLRVTVCMNAHVQYCTIPHCLDDTHVQLNYTYTHLGIHVHIRVVGSYTIVEYRLIHMSVCVHVFCDTVNTVVMHNESDHAIPLEVFTHRWPDLRG